MDGFLGWFSAGHGNSPQPREQPVGAICCNQSMDLQSKVDCCCQKHQCIAWKLHKEEMCCGLQNFSPFYAAWMSWYSSLNHDCLLLNFYELIISNWQLFVGTIMAEHHYRFELPFMRFLGILIYFNGFHNDLTEFWDEPGVLEGFDLVLILMMLYPGSVVCDLFHARLVCGYTV